MPSLPTPTDTQNPKIIRAQSGPQSFLLSCPAFEIFTGGARGGGKGSPLDALVLTPFGWKQMGEIQVGTKLCNPDGAINNVIAIYPLGKQKIFRVAFTDGASCEVTDDHLWLAWKSNKLRKVLNKRISGEHSARLWTTSQLIDELAISRKVKQRITIPITAPVALNRTKHTIDPYTLGAFLGGGSMTLKNCTFGGADKEIIDRMIHNNLVGTFSEPKLVKPHTALSLPFWVMRVCRSHKGQRNFYASLYREHLIGCKANNKFIPPGYLTAETSFRWELLRGLMDTDGSVAEGGKVTFCTVSPQLAKDVTELARSLGAIVTQRVKHPTYTYKGEKRNGQIAYELRLKFKKNSNAFHLSRKKIRCTPPQSMGRYVESIEFSRYAEAQCIKVSNPNGLYITNDYIVTHNTVSILLDWLAHATRYGRDAHGIVFRRHTTEFNELITLGHSFLDPIGWEWKEQKATWIGPNGADWMFRYLEHDRDVEIYKGWSKSHLALDEAADWPFAEPVDKLRAIVRSGAKGVVPRMVLTGNPGGRGHEWVKERYILPAAPMTIYTNKFGLTQCFIPSTIRDNPALLENDPLYINRLRASGPSWLVRAWLEGDWDIVMEGTVFKRNMLVQGNLPEEAQVRLPAGSRPIDVFEYVVQCWDTAIKEKQWNDYSALTVWGKFHNKYYLLDAWRGKMPFGQIKQMIKTFYDKHGADRVIIEDRSSGESLLQELYREPVVPVALLYAARPRSQDKVARAHTVTPIFEAGQVIFPLDEPDPNALYSVPCENWLQSYLNELLAFQADCAHDDWVDSTVYALDYMIHKLAPVSDNKGRRIISIYGR